READLSHADGKARFAAAARPLFLKVPAGVYRELLLERLASVVGLSAERLQALWVPAAAAPPAPPTRRLRAPMSAGRGSLVRQAIVRLLHHPGIAAEVTEAERAGLAGSDEPGVELLRELIDELRENPAQIPAQVIERWSAREGGEALRKLLERETVRQEAPAAAAELRAGLAKLARQADARRLQMLEDQSRRGPLSSEELEEFQSLMSSLQPGRVRNA
ncbi:MAG: hypothetical protein JOZ03_01660, partial [Gammaproteobacteria bacterium]|nr:hypothetical protein [Gammaproteobacteria bacterium]